MAPVACPPLWSLRFGETMSRRLVIELLLSAVYLVSLLVFYASSTRLLGFGILYLGSFVILLGLFTFRSAFLAVPFLLANAFFIPLHLIESARSHPLASGFTVSFDLKYIAYAMEQYRQKHGHLLAHAVYGPDGKALYSWRVELLPFLEQESLYKEFRLDEPWDSPENLKLLPRMPSIYRSRCHEVREGNSETHIQVFVGPGAAFEGTRGLSLERDLPDSDGTILVVETFEPVPWTKPVDIPFGPDQAFPTLGDYGPWRRLHWWYLDSRAKPPSSFCAGLTNGSTRLFSNPPDHDELRRWVIRRGREPKRLE